VKIDNLTNGLIAALLLASPIVGAETQYPASDFKPKVIFQDIDSSANKSAAAPVSTKQVKTAEVDSKYPAADFEPKVLYKDADYKPGKSTVTSSSSAAAASSASSITADVAESAAVAPVEEESMLTYLLGLGVFAAVGYSFLRKRETPKAKTAAKVYASHASGLSGVARYLRTHNKSAATGVARYLESLKSAEPVSGVEKYLEKQAKSVKENAAQAKTGVEKYMRNRR
jgi:hypothetical protein